MTVAKAWHFALAAVIAASFATPTAAQDKVGVTA